MAELLGTAASVIQVAEVGFSLATTLYKYAASVKGAEKDIKKIARDVNLTSKVLESTHKQLKHDQQASLCTQDALFDLEEVLDGCKEAFQEVDDALKKSLKPGSDGKLGISTFDKLKWPLRSNKLDVLRAHLEKLKTTLLLMLTVLAYGSKISQKAETSINVELTIDHLQIQNLVAAKDAATQRYEDLRAAFAKLEMKVNDQSAAVTSSTAVMGTNAISMVTIPESNPSTDEFGVADRLKLCAGAVSRLATTIDSATTHWSFHGQLKHREIHTSLKDTTHHVSMLKELSRDLRDKTSSTRSASGRPAATLRGMLMRSPRSTLTDEPMLRVRSGEVMEPMFNVPSAAETQSERERVMRGKAGPSHRERLEAFETWNCRGSFKTRREPNEDERNPKKSRDQTDSSDGTPIKDRLKSTTPSPPSEAMFFREIPLSSTDLDLDDPTLVRRLFSGPVPPVPDSTGDGSVLERPSLPRERTREDPSSSQNLGSSEDGRRRIIRESLKTTPADVQRESGAVYADYDYDYDGPVPSKSRDRLDDVSSVWNEINVYPVREVNVLEHGPIHYYRENSSDERNRRDRAPDAERNEWVSVGEKDESGDVEEDDDLENDVVDDLLRRWTNVKVQKM